MRFILLDRVTALDAGRRIVAEKALSLAEEYLADHFPAFPVLPGVLMIEGLVQTAAMLVRVTNNFQQSMIVLHEARNVKYKSFLKPGMTLRMEVTAKELTANGSSFQAAGFVDDQPIVEARLKLRHYNLADDNPSWQLVDERINAEMKRRAQLVGAW
ncbi:MAG: beta-hydroxyacyl-ACP dehydratase [Sedimentisphaerales bacterium]|nr:beta-hydroxyacyl-ACP dehydratase [Sedimentisphaerales bacterium]